MASLFAQANGLTRAIEQGFVIDNGGPTNLGVTIPFLADYWKTIARSGTPTLEDIRKLARPEADAAFEALLWIPLNCGFLPAGVGYALFDAAVNSGAYQAALWLQRIVGATPDGVIGQKTITAVNATDPVTIIKELSKARSRLMLGMNNTIEEVSEKGWVARLIEVTANGILINLGKLKA